MTKKMHCWSLASLPLAIGLASFSGSANAANFYLGEVEGQFDSQISIGASMSTQNADKRFISVPNGGEAAARTSDDGRQNYEAGDVFSKIFRGVHDLELRYGDSGAFFRGKYWYDFETKDGSQRFYNIDDSGRNPLQKGAGVALLDAFVYHNYFIGNNPGNVRLGRQVVEMLYFSQGLTDNLSMEAFYQLKQQETIIDNCGTFFGPDTLAVGCTDRLVYSGEDFGQGKQPDGTIIARVKKDRKASDDGQFGVAFRYFAPELNDTEFGFYAMNYHSRTPIYSSVAGTFAVTENSDQLIPGIDGVLGAAGYFFEYPEDIRLYGVSFQTSINGTSVGGELSYRPNMPLQLNTGDMSRTALVNAGTGQDNTHRGTTSAFGSLVAIHCSAKVLSLKATVGRVFFQQVNALHFKVLTLSMVVLKMLQAGVKTMVL